MKPNDLIKIKIGKKTYYGKIESENQGIFNVRYSVGNQSFFGRFKEKDLTVVEKFNDEKHELTKRNHYRIKCCNCGIRLCATDEKGKCPECMGEKWENLGFIGYF